MKNRYMTPRNTRREARTLAGTYKAGSLYPVMATAVRESESMTLTQSLMVELDPIPGRLLSEVRSEIIVVYVPAPAIDALKNPEDDLPGNSELFRNKLLSGNSVFELEDETEISKRLGVNPRAINGVQKVSEAARLAYLVATNHLFIKKHIDAYQATKNRNILMPALYRQTSLDRMNAVLDPEDRINGQVTLEGEIPIKGLGIPFPAVGATNQQVLDTEGQIVTGDYYDQIRVAAGQTGPRAYADMKLGEGLSLKDFYTARRVDELTRDLRKVVDDNPQYGEELATRLAHGLSVEVGNQPFVLYQKEAVFRGGIHRAMDGANLDESQTDLAAYHEFTVPVPATEFGGIVVTLAVLRPDEVMPARPHPILSDTWGARNYMADELAIDPQPVTARELWSDVPVGDESTIMMYNGKNHLMKNYVDYGFNRHLDTTTVANKTAIWQAELPLSVTPSSIYYPSVVDHYPFADQLAEVATYTINSVARVATPIIFGPTPIEELAEIETEQLFDEA